MPSPEKFKKSLIESSISKEIIDEINANYGYLQDCSPVKNRCDYFTRATQILDEKADPEIVATLFQNNACSLSGKRLRNSKRFARDYGNLPIS